MPTPIASAGTPDSAVTKNAYLTLNLAQNAGTYDMGTVSGGDILILSATAYNSVAAGGLVSVAIKTNDTTLVTLLAATILATLLGGLSLVPFVTPTVLPNTKKIQGIIVGTGNAGTIKLAVQYLALAQGALLS